MSRQTRAVYLDPADQIWLACAQAIGLKVERTRDAYAMTDGHSELAIGTDDLLDRDDCLAQMIFHEICHSLVEGPGSFSLPDWGLDNASLRDEHREHACLRAQAHLAEGYGLREVLAPTTDFRTYYDQLSANPLENRSLESVQLAIAAIRRASKPPWAPHLHRALAATAGIAQAVRSHVPETSATLPSLWELYRESPEPHPTEHGTVRHDGETCGSCAWQFVAGPGKPVPRCRQANGTRVDPTWPRCERWERELDCLSCGACCRAAYDSVTVSRRDRVVKLHPELIVDRGHYVELRRTGDRCAALEGGELAVTGSGERAVAAYHCRIYGERPKPCREFEAGGEHCLTARRRLALSL